MARTTKFKKGQFKLRGSSDFQVVGNLTVDGTTTLTGAAALPGQVTITGDLIKEGGNGALVALDVATTLLATTGGAGTESASNLIPANSLVLAVTARVTTVITGGGIATFSIGDGSDADRWGAGVAVAADTTSATNTTTGGAAFYVSATSVVLTANAGTFTTGAVRLHVFYIRQTPPTS